MSRRRARVDDRTQRNLIFAAATSYLTLFGFDTLAGFPGAIDCATGLVCRWQAMVAWLVGTVVAVDFDPGEVQRGLSSFEDEGRRFMTC